jgi:hypothetical protein
MSRSACRIDAGAGEQYAVKAMETAGRALGLYTSLRQPWNYESSRGLDHCPAMPYSTP